MPTPLHLSDEEMDLLLVLAAPIDQRLRHEFLAAVAAELEANGPAGAVGIGSCVAWRARFRALFRPAATWREQVPVPLRAAPSHPWSQALSGADLDGRLAAEHGVSL
jgi:hypothetical protein